MGRCNHYLKKNHNSEMPTNILFVDTEASIKKLKDGSQHQTFRLGYAIHLIRKEYDWIQQGYELHSVDDFWKLLDDFNYDKKRLYVFAHNMAYDYTILKLDSYISSRNLEIKMRVIDSVFLVKAENILFLSSTNYYKQSLKELGEIFGLSKMESPDFESCSDSELMPYCKRDTEVLAQIIIQHIAFISDYDLGSFKPTIAGQAFTAYRHRFMNHDLLVHTYSDILDLERQSYRGGRCEAFRIGKFKDIHCLDINSMYPFVMKTKEYPTVLSASKPIFHITVKETEDTISDGNFVMADCKLILKEPLIACKREKLIFPIGKVRQVLTNPEIEYILSHPECGKIKEIISAVTYQKANIFSDYVDFFYGIRQSTKNRAINQMAKLFLNSLYGKLGQHNSTIPELVTDAGEIKLYFSMMEDLDTFEIFTGLSTKYIKIGNSLYKVSKNDADFARDSIPIIASSVTAYSRMLLWELITKAGRENVYYVDTDSLFVNDEGMSNLHSEISSTELGKLKLEKEGEVLILGAKDYTFNDVTKLKGVKSNAERLPNSWGLLPRSIPHPEFNQFQFQTKNARYRDATPDGIVVLSPVIKKISHTYDKGIVKDSVVIPHKFSDF